MKKFLFLCCFLAASTTTSLAQTHVANPELKAKTLQKQLKLSDAQTAKIAAIYQVLSERIEEIERSAHGDADKIRKDTRPLREATNKKIKAVLTPPQAAKFDALPEPKGMTNHK